MPNEDIYQWDAHSDQPHVIRNKSAKRVLYIKGAAGSLKTALTGLLLPLVGLRVLFKTRGRTGQIINGIGLCVNPDTALPEKRPVATAELVHLVDELGVENLLIRLPLADIENLDRYTDFVQCFTRQNTQPYSIVVNILQDRRHIEDKNLLLQSLQSIFSRLHSEVTFFQIGNAVNRRKWAFISLDEYFRFFRVAEQLRNASFPALKLVGGNIIDFELPNFARSVIHGKPVHYDATAALLYVDRRGAPENRQLGSDLLGKINWFHQLVRSSRKSGKRLWITETNWPLKDTEPFAPAVGACMVSEKQQANFLARYFLLVIASGKVEKCFWHQLVAPGYGLLDNRGEQLRKRDAYYSFKLLNQLFNGATVTGFKQSRNGVYQLRAKNARGEVLACWSHKGTHSLTPGSMRYLVNLTGTQCRPLRSGNVTVTDKVTYLLDYPIEVDDRGQRP